MTYLIYILLFGFSAFTLFIPELSNFEIGNIHFYILTLLIALDIYSNRRLSLLTFWNIAFVYVILSDILLGNYNSLYDQSIKYLLCANDVYNIGYLLNRRSVKLIKYPVYICKNEKLFGNIIFFLYSIVLLFLIAQYNIPALKLLFRSNIFLDGFLSCSTLLVSLLVGFYYVRIKNKNPIFPFVFSSPVICFLLIDGTRYRLLYAIVPFLIILGYLPINKIKFRNLALIGFFGIVAVVLSAYVKDHRRSIDNEYTMDVEFYDINSHPHKDYLSVQLAQYGSKETIVDMTYYANDYFASHPLKYGLQTGMIFYFWIPRSVWPDKPTMIDSWLPQLYMQGVSDHFSSASGFTGELRADFGMFSLLFVFFLGFLMKKADNLLYLIYYTKQSNYFILYVVLFVPFFFFAVRSPLTSYFNLIAQLVILYIINLLCFKRIDS